MVNFIRRLPVSIALVALASIVVSASVSAAPQTQSTGDNLLVNRVQQESTMNLPTRGIGAKSLDIIRETAKGSGQSLWDAAGACIADALGPKAALAVHGFMQLIVRLEHEIQGLALHEQVDHVINHSGLIEHHRREKADRGEARVENLEELVSAARGFTSRKRRAAECSPRSVSIS